MRKRISSVVVLLFIITCLTTSLKAQVILNVESGVVNTGYNDVRIPGNEGTFISLKDDLIPSSEFYYRLRLNYTFGSAHTLSLLYAPLTVKSYGRINKEI